MFTAYFESLIEVFNKKVNLLCLSLVFLIKLIKNISTIFLMLIYIKEYLALQLFI